MTPLTPEQEEKLLRDALRDLDTACINVRIALRDPVLPQSARAVLLTARDQIGWVTEHLCEVLA